MTQGDERREEDLPEQGTDEGRSSADEVETSAGALYGVLGAMALGAGVVVWGVVDEHPALPVLAFALVTAGFYALVAGAVARGVQMARR